MSQIFSHPWMKKMAKGYGIEMSHYIYKHDDYIVDNNYKESISPRSQ